MGCGASKDTLFPERKFICSVCRQTEISEVNGIVSQKASTQQKNKIVSQESKAIQVSDHDANNHQIINERAPVKGRAPRKRMTFAVAELPRPESISRLPYLEMNRKLVSENTHGRSVRAITPTGSILTPYKADLLEDVSKFGFRRVVLFN